MTRKIIHIDMDAFYASVEQRDNPALKGKPVLVGGQPNSRGVVAAASYEARLFGVHSAMPCATAARLCPEAIFVPPRFETYREVSQQVRSIFLSYTDKIEPLSLDEAYLDVSQLCLDKTASSMARNIRTTIARETFLSASAGISYNKFLAKMASDIRKPNGQFVITPEQGEAFVAQLPIGKFYGVGKATEARMLSLGICYGADLKRWSLAALEKHFGKWSQFLYNIARGIDERPVDNSGERKSIGAERTFSKNLSSEEDMLSILTELAEQVARSLEDKQLTAETLTIKVRLPDFTTVTRQCRSTTPIENTKNIQPLLKHLLQRTEATKKTVRLLGLSVSNLSERSNNTPVQLTFKQFDR